MRSIGFVNTVTLSSGVYLMCMQSMDILLLGVIGIAFGILGTLVQEKVIEIPADNWRMVIICSCMANSLIMISLSLVYGLCLLAQEMTT